jgi:outer membrane lipoprotein
MKPRYFLHLIVCLIFPITLGCVSLYHADVFSDTALANIDSTVTFTQIKESPDSHQGVTLMLGGEVLEAKRLKDHTRLIILQLPLDTYQEPIRNRTRSEGRFLAMQTEFLDPATVPKGTRLTLIGTTSGSTTEPLDEMDYTYPTFTIQHLKVWQEDTRPPYAYYPYRYWPYGPYSYFYGPRFGRYWYD